MANITSGSLIGGLGSPISGTAGCLVQWPGKTDQSAAYGRTRSGWADGGAIRSYRSGRSAGKANRLSLRVVGPKGPTTADVALVHVDPALVDPGIGPSGAPTGTNLNPAIGDKLTIFADGKARNLTITRFGDQKIDRVTPDSRASVNYLNQIICDPATEDRCVGAMAMDGSNKIVGMVVGGDGEAFTLVTPIDALLSCTFGGPPGPALEVCASVPATAKAPEKVTHPDHISGALRSTGALDAQSCTKKGSRSRTEMRYSPKKAPGVMKKLIKDFPDLTEEQAAAILGNIGHECGGFGQLQQLRGGGGRGWCQWDGTRRDEFFSSLNPNNWIGKAMRPTTATSFTS